MRNGGVNIGWASEQLLRDLAKLGIYPIKEDTEMKNELNPNAATPEYVKDMTAAMSLSKKQRYLLCDLGYYNKIMKGYLIKTLEYIGYDDEVIDRAIDHLENALDNYTAEEAEDKYRTFMALQNQ